MDLRRLTRMTWGWGEGRTLGLHTDGLEVRKTGEERVPLTEAGGGA